MAKFISLEEDLKGLNTPIWKEEGFADEDKYQEYYCRLIDDLDRESVKYWRNVLEAWKEADKQLENDSLYRKALISKSDIKFVPQAIEESVALLCESLPRPQCASKGPDDEQFTGQLNNAMDQELDANKFDAGVMPKVAYDMKRFFVGVAKVVWDPHEKGQFGNKGRNTIRKIDPRHVRLDPFAIGYYRREQRYLIVHEPMDLSEVRRRYPGKVVKAEAQGATALTSFEKTMEDAAFMHSGMSDKQYELMRHRVVVKECWLQSDAMITEVIKDAEGVPMCDADGNELKRTVKKYPNGRLIIVANGTVLADQHNPYSHGEHPYVFFPSRMAGQLLSYGDVTPLLHLEAKLNQLHKDAIRNLRVNMNAPWVIDRHAFDSSKKFNLLTQDPGLILPVATGARVERLQAGELPQSLYAFTDYLKQIFDDVLGVSGVNRGQLEKGAQLSADAVSQLQVASTARVRLKSRFLEDALKHMGYLLQWNIRQFYDSDFKVAVPKPGSSEKQVIGWNGDQAEGEYTLEIQAGSSLPGAKEAGASLMYKLWQVGLCDRAYAIRGLRLPDGERLIADMDKRDRELAALGMLAELNGKSNKNGKPGRKENLGI